MGTPAHPTFEGSDNPSPKPHGYWEYSQSKGTMTHVLPDGKRELAGMGYSGHGSALDDPEKQDAINQGPIPRGAWIIGPQRDHRLIDGKTLYGAMELAPGAGNATRRSDSLIHGDSAAHDHSASKGCIVLSRDVRDAIARSGDVDLEVVHP